jgi:hypothetical protein
MPLRLELHLHARTAIGPVARWLKEELNPRQLALVNHAMKRSDVAYTVESHRISHGVVYQTARTDLLHLASLRLLDKR